MTATTFGPTTRDIAAGYVRRGWVPLPIPLRSKNPDCDGWQKHRLDEAKRRLVLFAGRQNIGVLLGEPSGGLCDVDLDHPRAVELAPKFLPPTPAIFGRAGKPRSHYLYRLTEETKTLKRKSGSGGMLVELRWTGMQTVFPGSVHPNGETIEWEDADAEPAVVTADELRAAVNSLADAVLESLGEFPARRCGRAVPTEPMPDREVALSALAGLSAARADCYDDWITVGMSLHSVDPSATMLAEWEAWSTLSAKYLPGECQRKWAGFDAAGGTTLGTLLHLAKEDGWKRPRPAKRSQSAAIPPSAPPLDSGPVNENQKWTSIECDSGRTDLSFARRFLDRHGDRVQWVPEWGKWTIWDGTRWRIDVGNCGLTRMATDVSDAVWAEVARFHTEDAVDFAIDMAKPSRWTSALKAAAAQRTVPAADLNANPWLLNCPNGTVDLRSGELRPHRKEDNLTALCPTPYDPDAPSYAWDRFLESLFGDDEIIAFLRRLTGYSISGDVSEQVMPILYGEGANGKSTYLNALLDMLGAEYAMQGRAEMLMARKGESHPTELADLHGRRLVSCVETDDGRRLAEGLVKQLTGGERVRARRLYEDFWEFQPTHKVYLCTNHKPEVRGTDHAIWRRLVLVPFTKKFWNPEKGETGPDELRQDKTLAGKLRAEAAGILAWAVRGCAEWRAQGLQVPESVRAATNEFRSEQDLVTQFIAEKCVTGLPHYVVKASALYAAFATWCEESGERAVKQRRFGMELTKRGYDRYENHGVWYRHIALCE